MAIIKAINSRASIANTINYITKKEKTELKLISGINCSPDTAIEQMKLTKILWNKKSGRQYKHFVQSFPADENITYDEAHKIAEELIKRWNKFNGYEVIFATHKDREHIHTHIVVNSVSYKNGSKFRYSKKDLQNFKDISDKILSEHNKTICHKNNQITTDNIGEYKAIENASKGKYESWVLNIMIAVNSAKGLATSINEFISMLRSNGIETLWKDNKKYITFTDNAGNKIRNKRLSNIFKVPLDKEALVDEFKRNNGITTNDIEFAVRNRQAEQISRDIERRKSETERRNSEKPRSNYEDRGASEPIRNIERTDQENIQHSVKRKKRSSSIER